MARFTRNDELDQMGYEGAELGLMLGGGGSGKDTKSDILAALLSSAEYRLNLISTSGEIDYHTKHETPLGKRFNEQNTHILKAAGHLANDELVLEMIQDKLISEFEKGSKLFILNSAPRSEDQARAFLGLRKLPWKAYFFRVTRETLMRRAERRRQKEIAQGKAPRLDDEPDVVLERISKFEKGPLKAIRMLKATCPNRLVEIDGEAPIRDQMIKILRSRGFHKSQLGQLANQLDDPRHRACQLLREAETGIPMSHAHAGPAPGILPPHLISQAAAAHVSQHYAST